MVDTFGGKEKKIEEVPLDFSVIDVYPQFKNCDVLTFDESKFCFENTLHQHLEEQIQNLALTSQEMLRDTLKIKFSVDKKGKFKCNQVKMSDDMMYFFPNLLEDIQHLFLNLPIVEPAQKRAIPVISNFTIPLLIETTEVDDETEFYGKSIED